MNLNAEVEEELFLCLAEGHEDMILDDEAETMLYNGGVGSFIRTHSVRFELREDMEEVPPKPLTAINMYGLPLKTIIIKSKENKFELKC